MCPSSLAIPEHGQRDVSRRAGDVFGELGLSAWLADHELQADHSALAAAWDGDRAWRLRCGEEVHSVWLIQFDSKENADAVPRNGAQPPDRPESCRRASR